MVSLQTLKLKYKDTAKICAPHGEIRSMGTGSLGLRENYDLLQFNSVTALGQTGTILATNPLRPLGSKPVPTLVRSMLPLFIDDPTERLTVEM